MASLVALGCSGSPSSSSGDGDDDSKGSAGQDDGGNGTIGLGGGTGQNGNDDPDDDPVIETECGNGELEVGELCDDGNSQGGDGCSADCTAQDADFDCSTPGEPCVDLVVCGNGVLEGDEVCDDGNTSGEDGCSGDCSQITEGYACARPGAECLLLPECGNGARERGEQCDDGDDSDPNDGCHECAQAEDFFCVPGQACVPLACGDGNRTPDEECDDGPGTVGSPGLAQGGDGCSETCTVEGGWRCSASGCVANCGDGQLTGPELEANGCDDGNRDSGDGCSAACQVEPYYLCDGQPSECSSTIMCGNSAVEPGEICDPPGSDGCLAGCQSFSPDVSVETNCGNSVIEGMEECDAPNPGNGCTLGCLEEPGWNCPRPNECFRLPECGDGIVHFDLGEECDDGDDSDPNDGCHDCQEADGYNCSGLGPSMCVLEICGDGIRTPGEECDEGMGATTAGCQSCMITEGWVCPVSGEPCIEKCGDGQLVGDEECDLGDTIGGDGCNAACRIEPGYTCDDTSCTAGECGNGDLEAGEGCDDGNQVAGDGCGPTCQNEPAITRDDTEDYPDPVVGVVCGDGLLMGDEVCDDGNTEGGDGCAADCSGPEAGYVCTQQLQRPDTVDFQVTYRDFKRAEDAGGHPNFQSEISNGNDMVGPVCTTSNNTKCESALGEWCPANTCGFLDKDGKPVFHIPDTESLNARGRVDSPESFAIWYRDTNDLGVQDESGSPEDTEIFPITDVLTLQQDPDEPDSYSFSSNNFFPLNDRGFGDTPGQNKNFHFTTELRTYFQYRGGETLTFRGDDDVWVFINGHLAVDIGGVHGARWGRVILGDDGGFDGSGSDSNCSAHRTGSLDDCSLDAAEASDSDTDDTRFGLVQGGVYEIVLFHAERHTSQSNFNLTLAGFLSPTSACIPDCGDGIITGYEFCDDGPGNNKANPASGECNDTCTARAFCGDGTAQPGEACDNGSNQDLYDTGMAGQCAPGCELPPSCGDSEVQSAFEQCDNGSLNSASAYGPDSCNASCGLGLYCGDGTVTGPEEVCDDGSLNGTTYGPDSCGYDCQAGARCGDGVRNGPEECDDGALNGTDQSNCNTGCTVDPYCGDGVVSDGELCDYGQFASDGYGGCTDSCVWGPRCGDATLQEAAGEECDLGVAGNTGEYGGCSASCTFGPRCGDAVLQSSEGEVCDNGFNQDQYAFAEDSCGPNCSAPPFCGDGVLQSDFELCDAGEDNSDSAYDGCTSSCEWGPYCGDGITQSPEESCDDGSDNVGYSPDGSGCGYDCQPPASCGDGVRNGPEQCDEGSEDNSGEYGGCSADCTRAPFCGDGVTQSDEGEECDDGPTGSLECTPGCKTRSDGVK